MIVKTGLVVINYIDQKNQCIPTSKFVWNNNIFVVNLQQKKLLTSLNDTFDLINSI